MKWYIFNHIPISQQEAFNTYEEAMVTYEKALKLYKWQERHIDLFDDIIDLFIFHHKPVIPYRA